jgi:hypothetical protein
MNFKKFNVWLFLFIFSGILNVSLIGIFFNLYAISNNNCKMPVYEPARANLTLDSDRHFYFNESSQVDSFYLTDIFNVKTLYFSIGDLLLFISCVLGFGMNLILLKVYINYRRLKKSENAVFVKNQ